MAEYRIVVQVFKDDEKVAQVGGRTTGSDKFVEAFPDIYRQIDMQVMKVLEMGEVVDQPADDKMEGN